MSRRSADARPFPAPAWLPPLAIALLAAVQVYAFRWGVVTPDTLFQWGQALSGRYDDWHPPATTWLWRQLMPLGRGTAPVLLFDVALYWTGVWLIAETLRRHGRRFGMAAVILVAATPIPFGQVGSILKDPLLAACCLTAFGLSFAGADGWGWRRGLPRLLAVALLAFASATRVNAVFATAPLLVACLPERWSYRPPRLLLSLGLAALLMIGANRLIDDVALRPHHSTPIFSLVNFDLAGIAAHGGVGAYPDLDRATESRIASRCYDPAQFNPTYRPDCDAAEERLRDRAEEQGLGAATIWRRAVAAAPRAYLLHRLAHFNRNQRFLVADVPDDAVYLMKTPPNGYGLDFRANPATVVVVGAARAVARSPLGRPATWLAVALGLLIVSPRLPSGRMVAALAGSACAYAAAYAVVSVAPDLRYNLWTMLAAMTALAIAASEAAGAAIGRPRLLLAAMPTMLVVTGEIAARTIG